MIAEALNEESLNQLFREARTYSSWLDKPVTDDTLRALYDLARLGPTSVNSNPARILFVRSPEAKAKLLPLLAPANVEKVKSAPVTAIIGYDLRFYENLPKLFPHAPDYKNMFLNSPDLTESTARRNSSLQGAYLIMAARALGLDCGPLSGFDNAKVDDVFFKVCDQIRGVDQEMFRESSVRSNFLCNIGYGDRSKLRPRDPRLDFEEACVLL